MKQYRIDGGEVHSIADLYEQFNRELMAEQDWILGPTLDGLNDVLYRIDSEIRDGVPATFVWIDHAHSRDALGFDETQRWLNNKLAQPNSFNQRGIQSDLDELQQGIGKTYFEIILEIFAEHPLIELQLR
ncbi:ribonuclease inhibitor [Arthrobacter psychrolactophilus]|uniref:Ribonuclease inhibitor n=1 Tax=Arthrobacter psychrolactophilus TaxID=92442 RepID=A0A2V5ITN3_9MICC|nr:ribonuclease inhibitor [Arthrobacter psychrolactophilus]PYI37513.1 ribonuclease inhibitor [Arthrobacter psychrolactophilus]